MRKSCEIQADRRAWLSPQGADFCCVQRNIAADR